MARLKRKLEAQLKKLRHDDALTANEKKWRDGRLDRLSQFFRMHGVSANAVSYAGIALITIALGFLLNGYSAIGFLLAIAGLITDLLDGPVARWKDPHTGQDNVTGWGTFLDHARDCYFALVLGVSAVLSLKPVSMFQIFLGVSVAVTYMAIVPLVLLDWHASLDSRQDRISASGSFSFRIKEIHRRFSEYCLVNLQTSFWGRVQFGLLWGGILLLFLGKWFAVAELTSSAYVVFGGEIVMGVRNIIEERLEGEE